MLGGTAWASGIENDPVGARIEEAMFENQEHAIGYRLEVLVQSAQMRLIKITYFGESETGVFPVWPAQKRFDREIPYGVEIPITHALINPPWTPTKKMLEEQRKKIESGEKIPKGKIYRPYKPAEKGNPLGRMAFYFDSSYLTVPLRLHDNPGLPKAEIAQNGKPRGARISRGCARAQLQTLLPIANLTTQIPESELRTLIDTKKTHRLDLALPATIIFIKG